MPEPTSSPQMANASAEQPLTLKTWVTPTFEKTPLNEAMAGATRTTSATDVGTGYS